MAVTKNTAIAALVVNIVFPGVGSLIGGRTRTGIIQLVLGLIGLGLSLILIGLPLLLAVWVWALITGIQILNEAN